MKVLKNIVTIAAIFAVGSMCARLTKQAPGEAPAPRVAPEPMVAPAPAIALTYKQLRDDVLRMDENTVITGNKLNPTFINQMQQKVRASDLGVFAFSSLLQTARDKFAPFTDNNDENVNQLTVIKQQIDTAVKFFVSNI